MSSRQQLLAFVWFLAIIPCYLWAQDNGLDRAKSSINRKALVRRHNPQTSYIGKQQFLLGDGKKRFWVDATALQTFVPDTSLSLNMGLNLTDTTCLSQIDMKLDRWSGKAESRFRYNGQYFHVETVCSPTNQFKLQMSRPTFSTRITSDSIFEVVLNPIQFMTNNKTVDETKLSLISMKNHAAVQLLNKDDNNEIYQWYTIAWRGNASIKKRGNDIVLHCKGDNIKVEGKNTKSYSLDITMQSVSSMPNDHFFNYSAILPFTEYSLQTATGWQTFWLECGLADFSATNHPEAHLTEQRMVESLYNITANTPDDWWLQAPLTMWGFAKQIVMPLHSIARNHPEKLWQRPELIAAVYLVLHAYTYPTVVERFSLTPEDIAEFHTTIINTYAPYVRKAVDYLKTENPSVPSFLDSNALMVVAKHWLAEADSLGVGAESSEPGTLSRPADGLLFHMPLVTDLLSKKRELTVEEQSQLLFSIAAHGYPASWKVNTEYIVPLP